MEQNSLTGKESSPIRTISGVARVLWIVAGAAALTALVFMILGREQLSEPGVITVWIALFVIVPTASVVAAVLGLAATALRRREMGTREEGIYRARKVIWQTLMVVTPIVALVMPYLWFSMAMGRPMLVGLVILVVVMTVLTASAANKWVEGEKSARGIIVLGIGAAAVAVAMFAFVSQYAG